MSSNIWMQDGLKLSDLNQDIPAEKARLDFWWRKSGCGDISCFKSTLKSIDETCPLDCADVEVKEFAEVVSVAKTPRRRPQKLRSHYCDVVINVPPEAICPGSKCSGKNWKQAAYGQYPVACAKLCSRESRVKPAHSVQLLLVPFNPTLEAAS
eukprot:Platyproteum_vivax@DN4101_c0_g1_i2.p1